MIKQINEVGEFMTMMEHEQYDVPTIPTEACQKLRVNLIEEELKELKEAMANGDLVGVADGLADLIYVVNGTVKSCGMGNIIEALCDEVQRSNMSKGCVNEEEAEATILKYVSELPEGTPPEEADIFDYKQVADKFIVFRTTDGKGLKSINYSPANLLPIVESAVLDPKDGSDGAFRF